MKKLLLVIAILSASVLAGCGEKNVQPPAQPANQQTTEHNATENANFIGEEKAWDIALERAGITTDDVIFNRIELERDDGVWKYEIEFRKENTEYDVEVKADDGTIISYETDIE
ncbi:MAG: PepSY domain-containing protein [Clostridia bacterium]|nr:PepSY domain-containing protein [Clostridia bacterium]